MSDSNVITTVQVGDIVKIEDKRFRVLYLSEKICSICELDTTKLNIVPISFDILFTGIKAQKYIVESEHESLDIVDRRKFRNRSADIRTINRMYICKQVALAYAPTYLDLSGTQHKELIEQLMKTYNISRSSMWRLLRRYFQSGMKEISVVRKKREEKPQGRSYQKKTGRPCQYGVQTGCILDKRCYMAFDAAIDFYKSGRAKTFRTAYDMMNREHFTSVTMENGIVREVLLPIDRRPTYRQFTYYASKQLSPVELEEIKTSKREIRNDKRLLQGQGSYGAEYPGEKVEVDALSFDNELVSMMDRSQDIGRPIVYAMRDVLTHAIVAISVGFNDNSNLGLSALMLNLGDDKVAYCRRYGIELDDRRLWPSNFLPQMIYADRGADFKSHGFGRICNELGIERHLVTGASGSLKGTIESLFHQLHSMINPHTEHNGLIEKRYDSSHHKAATLTIEEFTRMLIVCVITYNQENMENYSPRLEEIQNNIESAPAKLWQYYAKAKGAPRPITDTAAYLWHILTPGQAKISRMGIELNGLRYAVSDDKYLLDKMFTLQNRKEKIDVRYDPRDNSRLYYVNVDSKLSIASLMEDIGYQNDVKGWTIDETKRFFAYKKKQNLESRQTKDQIRLDRYTALTNIMDEAKEKQKQEVSGSIHSKDLREARAVEKELHNRSNNISQRLDQISETTPALPVEEKLLLEQNDKREGEGETIQKLDVGIKDLSEDEYNDLIADFDGQ